MLFVHGNVSSSLFWQPTMLALPEPYRPLAIDLRGFGETDDEPVDATRGLRDYADDLAATVDALSLDSVHLVGWSMGGGVVLQYLVDRPGAHRAASLTLVDPVSPFGFGGTKGADGALCDAQGAAGGGSANPEFVERLAGQDRGDASPLSPRSVLLAHYVKPPHVPEHLDILRGVDAAPPGWDYYYPGDSRPSQAWPGFAPGDRAGAEHHGAHPFPDRRPGRGPLKPPAPWLRARTMWSCRQTAGRPGGWSLAISGWPGATGGHVQPTGGENPARWTATPRPAGLP